MSEDRPTLYTVPTELERRDGFFYAFAVVATLLLGWYFAQMGIPLPWMIPPVVLVAAWMLTGEPVADLRYIGWVASWLRSRLGQRQAHEWVAAFLHYVLLVHVPAWRANCAACLKSAQRRITGWRAMVNEAMQRMRSAASSWAFRTRSN